MEHTPIPDGKTGPFMRKPHNKITPEGAGYAFDERCPACRAEHKYDPLLLVHAAQERDRVRRGE